MTGWMLRYDFRAPDFGTPAHIQMMTALDQIAWADDKGCAGVLLPEHHGAADGYLPAPQLFGAAAAARTSQMTVLTMSQLTLTDPQRLAEQIAVLDLISGGRSELVLVPGYVRTEFAMMGVDYRKRVQEFEEKARALVELFTAGTARFRDRDLVLTPRPLQKPHPPLRYGGATSAGARRAAQLNLAFMPMIPGRRLEESYIAECVRQGNEPRLYPFPGRALNVFVTKDVEKTKKQLSKQLRHDMSSYSAWRENDHSANPFIHVDTDQKLHDSGLYAVVTPEECLELAKHVRNPATMLVHPLIGGTPPELGWECLELFVREVAPSLARIH